MNRPISVTLTLWLVLILTIWNLIKASTALAWRNVLNEFSVSLMPEITAVISIIWVIIGLVLMWGNLQKKVWSKKMLVGTAISYTVWFWSERIIWLNSQTNTVFVVSVNIIFLIIIYFATREAYERTNENPEIE
ncbi:MAG: hypothetical protein KF758_12690 [Anaerolineales bacterium]|nr:hypothetical protein [Anaerolineales bacterium]